MALVEAQLQHGLLLEQKKNPKDGDECFLLIARELLFEHPECWEWVTDPSYPGIKVAEVVRAPSLGVFGEKNFPCPIPKRLGITYKFALRVKLTKVASGWEFPVTLKMKTPDGNTQQHEVPLENKATEKWLDLYFGCYFPHKNGVIEFSAWENKGSLKSGLLIAGVVFWTEPLVPGTFIPGSD